MLSSSLHEQLFGSSGAPSHTETNIQKSIEHLRQFQLGSSESEKLEDIEFQLPKLAGSDLNQHFVSVAQQQSQPYVDLIGKLLTAKIPAQPKEWKYTKGWTKCVDPCR